jgi:hypothetical protein
MVEKKFNFYNVFKVYYKNINKSVFFYDYSTIKNFRPELYANSLSIFFINYFGIFYTITSNFIFNSDIFIIFTISSNKLKLLKTVFKIKKIFLNISIINYTFFKKNDKNLFLIKV